MRRLEKKLFATNGTWSAGKVASAVVLAFAIHGSAAAQSDDVLLDGYLSEIERLISDNNLEGARQKLAEATSANLKDESLEIVNSQLRLLESLNSSNAQDASSGKLTARDKLAATDLLDSLRVAMENGELGKVQSFTQPTEQTNSLLSAVFDSYSSLKVQVSEPEPDNETDSFLATLEFTELTTKDGNIAFPAQAWRLHRLRIVKSDGIWQTVLW